MNLVEVEIRTLDNTDFPAILAKAEALKKALQGASLLGFDPQKIDSQLTVLQAKLQSHGVADLLDINMNQGRIEQQLMLLKRKISDAGISDLLDVNLNEAQVGKQLADLEHSPLHAGLQFTPEFTKNVDLSNVPVRGVAEPIRVTAEGVQSAVAELGYLTVAEHNAASAADDLGTAAAAAAGSGGGGRGGGVAALGAAAGGSGRALYGWGGILRMSVGGIALWHVALDGAIESLISVGTAAAAAAVGIAAMTPAAQDIYTHLKAVNTVNSSLGSSIPPLTGQFQDLAHAMAPQTIEAYGGALNLVSGSGGTLARVAGEVVTGIDDMVARFDAWNSAQKHTGALLQDGVGFLSQFEHILGQAGLALDNLIRADPGTAHMLLDVAGAAASLLNVITKLPAPVLGAALALHSVYLWGNVASGTLGKIIGGFAGVGKSASGVSKTAAALEKAAQDGNVLAQAAVKLQHGFHLSALASPQALGIAALIAGITDIAVNWDKADAAARSFISSLDTGLANMPADQAIIQISADIGQLNDKIRTASSSQAMTQLSQTWKALGSTGMAFGADFKAVTQDFSKASAEMTEGHVISSLAAFARGVQGIFVPGQGKAVVAANNVAAYAAEIQKLLGQQGHLFTETGKLMQQGYNYTQSLALLDLAGVRAGDSLQLMDQKVKNLITGYENMSVSGGMLANSVNAVSFASLQQQSKVSQLNSAWDTFFSTVSGGESGFEAFAQQTIGLYQSMTTSGLKVTDSNGKVGASLALLASSAGGTAVSMNGLNSASLTARQTFVQSASAANSEMDSLTTLASAAGLGARGTGLLTQANKDLVAALLPAAKGSSDMTAILYALAQRGGYQGADSFQALSKWVGNTRHPMQELQGIVQTFTKAAGNLTTDVQNLSTALGTTLNNAMATAIFTVSGGQKMLTDFANAVVKTGADSAQTQADALKLAEGLTQVTGSVNDARSEFVSFAEGALHMTQAQADTLWRQTLPGLQGFINKMHGRQLDLSINASQALNAVAMVNTGLANINSKTVDLYVNTYNSVYGNNAAYNSVYGRGGKLTYATGGIVGHAAAGGVQGGLVTVGELGPELAQLPQGTRVWPHGVMPPGVRGGDGGSAAGQLEITLRVQPSGNALTDALMKNMRVEVRRIGGDPLMFQKKVAYR